jgi:hypothetical protein
MRDAPAVSAPSCRHRLDERTGGATAVAAAELNVARDSPGMRARLRVRLRLAARGLAREPCRPCPLDRTGSARGGNDRGRAPLRPRYGFFTAPAAS